MQARHGTRRRRVNTVVHCALWSGGNLGLKFCQSLSRQLQWSVQSTCQQQFTPQSLQEEPGTSSRSNSKRSLTAAIRSEKKNPKQAEWKLPSSPGKSCEKNRVIRHKW